MPSRSEWERAASKLHPGDIIEYHFHGKEPTICVVIDHPQPEQNEDERILRLQLIFGNDQLKKGYPPDENGYIKVRGSFPHKLLKRVQRSE